jgi:hypothetical protein
MAGNQLGKTLAGGFEVAMHSTGRYPDWWQGKRFDKPTVGWACGVTGEVVRDTVQKILVGRTGQEGTGPKLGLMDMLDRMQSGRFKVFKHLNDWWEEFRLYHRKDGKVVKEGDDLMCATRYALMSLRHASTVRSYQNFRRRLVYPKAGIA